MAEDLYTEKHHVQRWWGLQKCRRCNPHGEEDRETVACPDCPGTGWTEWAALATEPWTHIHAGLWLGGCEYNLRPDGRDYKAGFVYSHAPFQSVISVWWGADDAKRYGPHPNGPISHHLFPFLDTVEIDDDLVSAVMLAYETAVQHLDEGNSVMIRCQAGLNRSGLVAALVLMDYYGFDPYEAVALMRKKRSPWVLCNEVFEQFVLGDTYDRCVVT